MVKTVYLSSMRFSILLFVISLCQVEGDVTLRASASQSHPMEGHSTELTCEVRSMNQSQVVVWSKDQKSITWGNSMGQMMSSRFELAMNRMDANLTKYELTINDINRDDDGRYQCQVLQVNGMGYSAMASDTLILSVLYFPNSAYPYCSVNGSQTVLTGAELTSTCISEAGNPQISSHWSVADGAVAPLTYHIAESSSMVLSELELTVSQDLQGVTYICQVTSPAYPEFDRTCSLGPLRILDWPIVTITRSVSRVPEGTDVHFICNTEPMMTNLRWITNPEIDPERLVITNDGLVLTVKNVLSVDNATDVFCQVPYRDTEVEARSVIILDDSTINKPWITPSFHATSELCMPWFGAFLFTVTVNLILCVIIVRLLVNKRKLVSKSKIVEPDADSLKGVNTEMMEPKKGDAEIWPANVSNWSMRSEKQLQHQRHKSWQYIPPTENENNPATTEIRTYTELSPDTMDVGRVHREASFPEIGLKDSAPYVTPNTRSKPIKDPKMVAKAGTAVPVKAIRKTGLASIDHKMKKHTTKSSNHHKKNGIKTVSGQGATQVEMGPYMDLNESTIDTVTQKPTYQALKKTPNSTRYTSKTVAPSSKKKLTSSKKSNKADKDEMTGDSGIYGEGGSYMKYGDEDVTKVKYDNNIPTEKQGSMMGESAPYMPTSIIQSRYTSASANRQHSGTLSSASGTDANDPRYERPPDSPIYSTGTTDDGMSDAIYVKSISIRGGRKLTARSQTRATVSNRAPMPKPIGGGRQDLDPSSTDESYKEPYRDKNGAVRTYFTLEPDHGSYHNYGADVSSENDSYQGSGSFDWDPAENGVSKKSAPARQVSSASDASYLELGDAEGEIKGYVDMTKNKPIQTKVPSKVSMKLSQVDSEGSSNEYYQPMEGESNNEYSIPSNNKLRSVTEEGADPGTTIAKGKTTHSSSNKQKKRDGWGLFKK